VVHPTASADGAKGEIRCWNVRQESSLSDTATAGPCTSLDIHPDGTRFAVTQTISKGSYPESCLLAIHDLQAESKH
jgi:WD40 repeat protein